MTRDTTSEIGTPAGTHAEAITGTQNDHRSDLNTNVLIETRGHALPTDYKRPNKNKPRRLLQSGRQSLPVGRSARATQRPAIRPPAQRCQFMKMVGGGPRLRDLANLPPPIFFSSDFGHFILKIQKKNFKK